MKACFKGYPSQTRTTAKLPCRGSPISMTMYCQSSPRQLARLSHGPGLGMHGLKCDINAAAEKTLDPLDPPPHKKKTKLEMHVR